METGIRYRSDPGACRPARQSPDDTRLAGYCLLLILNCRGGCAAILQRIPVPAYDDFPPIVDRTRKASAVTSAPGANYISNLPFIPDS